MRQQLSLPLGLALALLAATAHPQWKANGEVVPDTEWRKSSGDFGAMLLVTNDPDGFLAAWNRPPSPDYPSIEASVEAHRGDAVVGVVVFRGCAPNESGNCQLDMDQRLLYPDGSVYGELNKAEVWNDKPAPPTGHLQISVASLGLRVEPDDPFGTYRFEAVVRDQVAGKALILAQSLEVVPPKGDVHLQCSEFVAYDMTQRTLFTKGLLAGVGATLGALSSAVRAVQESTTDANTAKGAELAAAGVTKALSGDAGKSDQAFAKSIAEVCALPNYAERPAASAALDLLMGIKP